MIKNTVVSGNIISSPTLIFTSSKTGGTINSNNLGQSSAITTIVICNTLMPSSTDSSVNAVSVNVYLVIASGSPGSSNLIVSNLLIPAGETIFFSNERIILDAGDTIHVGATVANAITVTVSSILV